MSGGGGDLSLASLPPTAPGGGDFGAPLTSRTDTVDESNIGGPSRLKLKIAPAPPQYPYADTYFNLEVYVVDQHESLQRGEELPLSVTLAHYVSGNPAPPGVLNIDPSCSRVISKSGNCTMRIKISDDKNSMERRRFRLKVEAINRSDIEPAVTEKLTVIRNRLEIRENPENPVPEQWYKDEGGRENCVELQVHLLGPKGDEVKSRRVPLRLVLMYENMHRVHNQEILKLSPDSKLVIDEQGKATLRVRIEEVSKNHQKQAFRIKVEPDVQEQPMSMDISPVVSKPITVLSKRINKPKGKRSVTPVGGVKRVADPGYVTSISRADQSSLERRVNFSELISPSAGPVDTTNVSLYEALKSVIEWTGQVVNGLQAVQWQLLGYESKSDGQPDHDRPLYSMSNPNPVVNSIVRRYATDTMTNLHVLLKRIEAGSFDDPVGGGGGNGGGARAPSPSTPVPTPNMHSAINSPSGMHHLHSAGSSPSQGPHQWEGQGSSLSVGVGGSGVAGGSSAGHHHNRATPGRAVGVTIPGGRGRNDSDRMLSQQQGGGSPGHHPMGSSSSGAASGPSGGESAGGGGGAVGAGGQPPSKRPRTSPVGGGVGTGGAGSGSAAGGGNGSGKGMASVVNGGVHHSGAGTGNAVGGSAGGNGSGGNGGPSEGPRSTSPPGLDDPPPSVPTLAPGAMSHMIVSRSAGGGGNHSRRTPNFPFPSPLLPSFSEGPSGGNGGDSSVGQPPAGGSRLRDEPSLPTGVTDPAEVDVFFILAKGYLSHELGMLGFPAYDRSQMLLGFYKEVQSQGGQTQVVFIPARRIANLDDRDTAATTEILREEMRKGSQSIISYDNSSGSLEKMREDAFMYYWSKSMIIDMESNEAGDQQSAV